MKTYSRYTIQSSVFITSDTSETIPARDIASPYYALGDTRKILFIRDEEPILKKCPVCHGVDISVREKKFLGLNPRTQRE